MVTIVSSRLRTMPGGEKKSLIRLTRRLFLENDYFESLNLIKYDRLT